MRENRPYGSEGGASQTNGTSLPPIVGTLVWANSIVATTTIVARWWLACQPLLPLTRGRWRVGNLFAPSPGFSTDC